MVMRGPGSGSGTEECQLPYELSGGVAHGCCAENAGPRLLLIHIVAGEPRVLDLRPPASEGAETIERTPELCSNNVFGGDVVPACARAKALLRE